MVTRLYLSLTKGNQAEPVQQFQRGSMAQMALQPDSARHWFRFSDNHTLFFILLMNTCSARLAKRVGLSVRKADEVL